MTHKGKFRKDTQEAINFFSENEWVVGGDIYIRKQKVGFCNESPVVFSVKFRKDMPKHEYVSFSFILDEEIAPTISVIDQDKDKEYLKHLRLIGKF
jgi:hypothetical protein